MSDGVRSPRASSISDRLPLRPRAPSSCSSPGASFGPSLDRVDVSHQSPATDHQPPSGPSVNFRPMKDAIVVRGARQHNLKNFDLRIPRRTFTVITGPSGSGKSSLAFDTIYAEGQRRYVESLSAYARQFLERMEKPDVDHIDGLSPAVAIEQKNPTKTSRSTVGTATEIYDYLRLFWARIGRTFCPKCGREMRPDTVQSVSDTVTELPTGTRFSVAFPLRMSDEVTHEVVVENLRAAGFLRLS